MPRTDEENLVQLKTWRDNLVDALKTPETTSGYGGFADSPGGVMRTPARAELKAELESVEEQISALEDKIANGGVANPENEVYLGESRGLI